MRKPHLFFYAFFQLLALVISPSCDRPKRRDTQKYKQSKETLYTLQRSEVLEPKQREGKRMAFTRSFLKTMNLTDEQISAIIEEHTNVTDALKAQRDKAQKDAESLKAEADKIPDLQKQLADIANGEDYKGKWEQEHKAFEDYKAQIAKDAEMDKVRAAYRKLLQDEHINDKRLDVVMRASDFTNIKLGSDGNLEKLDTLKQSIGEEWGDFKVQQRERKQNVANPPANHGGGESRARELYTKHLQMRGIKVDAGKE